MYTVLVIGRSGRSPQLDSLRAIAALMVVAHHWTDWSFSTGISLGNVGVQLFFVLSGFLITRILLDLNERRAAGALVLRGVLSSFHLSRIARIWPVYFLTIGLVFAAGDRFERQADMGWHAMFASNLLFFQRGAFDSNLAHFWSLAVEQQFYLVWPLVVLLVPARALETVILALVALAPITRSGLHAAGFTEFAQYNVLPLANFDSLGLGALVALWSRSSVGETAGRRRLLSVCASLSALGILVLSARGASPANSEQTLYAIVFAWLIAHASRGFVGPLGRGLEWPPLVALGLISYGVYVYHVFAPRIAGAALRAVAVPVHLQSGVALFILSTVLTLLVASLSWFILERPMMELRRRARSPLHLGANT